MKTPPNLDTLIAIARFHEQQDARHKSKGRPVTGFKDDVKLVEGMVNEDINLKTIHTVLKSQGLTHYKQYGTFQQAWIREQATHKTDAA